MNWKRKLVVTAWKVVFDLGGFSQKTGEAN
jgi:hypothetical protein